MSIFSDVLELFGFVTSNAQVGVDTVTAWIPLSMYLEGPTSVSPSSGYQILASSRKMSDLQLLLHKAPSGTLAALQTAHLIQPDPADLTQFQVSLTLRIQYPAAAGHPQQIAGTGPLPVVVLNHGHHRSWVPTPAGGPVTGITVSPSLNGYAYLQDQLARHGLISVSVDHNFGCFTNSVIETRADTIIGALAALAELSARPASATNRYHGRLDFTRIGLMGHSRGGDAVVRAVQKIRADAGLSSQFTVLTACSLAPTDYSGTNAAASRISLRAGDLKFYLVVYGALDGDVSGADGAKSEAGTGFRHYDRAGVPKAMVFLDNCCHNRFNSVWQADYEDYNTSDARLASLADHQSLAVDYLGDLFRWQLGGEKLSGRLDGRIPNQIGQAASLQWLFGQSVRQVDDFETAGTNDLGGARSVTNPGQVPAAIQDLASISIGAQSLTPYTGHQTQVLHLDVTQLSSGGTRVLSTDIPAASQDWSGQDTLVFSLSGWFDPASPATIAAASLPRATITLVDSAGATASMDYTGYGPLRPSRPVFKLQPIVDKHGTMLTLRDVTLMRLETIPIALTAFAGVNLARVAHVAVDVVPGNNSHVFIDNVSVVKRQ